MLDRSDSQGTGSVPLRVLLVEDNPIVAMSAEEQLLEIGVGNVLVAHSVAEALTHCENLAFDFALLDFDLGNETSIKVAQRLKGADIPFVFASGFGDLLDLPEELHGSRTLRKPYLLSDLERVVCLSK